MDSVKIILLVKAAVEFEKLAQQYTFIDPIFQKMLDVNEDSKLGPETQTALDRYKKSIGYQPSAITNQLTFEFLKKEPEYASRQSMDQDEMMDIYVTNYIKRREHEKPTSTEVKPDKYDLGF